MTDQQQFVIRDAVASDVDRLVAFEIEIARISFPDDAIEDPAMHERRVRAALDEDRDGTFVAVTPDRPDEALGWAWISPRTNFLSQQRYAYLRSVAVDASVRGTPIAQQLLKRAITFAREIGTDEVIGKVHAENVPMRAAYAAAGFSPNHLTMRRTDLAERR